MKAAPAMPNGSHNDKALADRSCSAGRFAGVKLTATSWRRAGSYFRLSASTVMLNKEAARLPPFFMSPKITVV